MPNNPEPLVVPMSMVPHYLGCGRTKAYQLKNEGALEVVMIGNMPRITMRSIKALIEPQAQEAR